MQIVIEKLIEFCNTYKVAPSISFVPDCGSMYIYISFDYRGKRIKHMFYYTMSPNTKDCIEHFKMYEPTFEIEIERMIKELKDADMRGDTE